MMQFGAKKRSFNIGIDHVNAVVSSLNAEKILVTDDKGLIANALIRTRRWSHRQFTIDQLDFNTNSYTIPVDKESLLKSKHYSKGNVQEKLDQIAAIDRAREEDLADINRIRSGSVAQLEDALANAQAELALFIHTSQLESLIAKAEKDRAREEVERLKTENERAKAALLQCEEMRQLDVRQVGIEKMSAEGLQGELARVQVELAKVKTII